MLTPAPLYPAFPNDFKARGKVEMQTITTKECNLHVPQKAELEEAYKKCIKKGSNPRILLLCNPVNPTGVIYTVETLKMCIDWANSKGMHIVCDEIYGNSLFPGEKQTSIAEVMH